MDKHEASARDGQTKVTFLDQTGSKSVDAVITATINVRRILPTIIAKMNLPVTGPDGQPVSYSLDHKEGGRRLHEEQTLPEADVQDGDHLIIYAEMVAGAAWILNS
ncbi:MAG: hypothetical protein CMJ75_20880 [Planctomycetaceae bacterium]|nr:hypothetical protein [Planctomycetaceae bacterium]